MNRSRLLKKIPWRLDAVELAAAVHLDPDDPADVAAFREMLTECRRIAAPKAFWQACRVGKITGDRFFLDDLEFAGRLPAKLLAGREQVFVYCATCGVETDILLDTPDPLQRFWADEIRVRLMRDALETARHDIMETYEIPRLSSLAPGSGETEQVWGICQLKELFELAGGAFSTELGVTLTDSFLMLPTKTVAGIFFAAEHDFANCQVCQRVNCPNRKAPFDETLWKTLQLGSTAGCGHEMSEK